MPPLTTATPDAGDVKPASAEMPIEARFIDVPLVVERDVCSRVVIAVVSGSVSATNETLVAGDVLVVAYAPRIDLQGKGVAVMAALPIKECIASSAPNTTKEIVRGRATPPVTWAGGAMTAHLDVGRSISPTLYVGRLEGTSGVGEHVHADSWEILAAIDASGTFTRRSGTKLVEQHLSARQVVAIPPGTKHAWKPDLGSKLVAIQMYLPPGPEERFLALAAAEAHDGGVVKEGDAGAPDNGKSAPKK